MGKPSVNGSFSMAMLNNQKVYTSIWRFPRSWGVPPCIIQVIRPWLRVDNYDGDLGIPTLRTHHIFIYNYSHTYVNMHIYRHMVWLQEPHIDTRHGFWMRIWGEGLTHVGTRFAKLSFRQKTMWAYNRLWVKLEKHPATVRLVGLVPIVYWPNPSFFPG